MNRFFFKKIICSWLNVHVDDGQMVGGFAVFFVKCNGFNSTYIDLTRTVAVYSYYIDTYRYQKYVTSQNSILQGCDGYLPWDFDALEQKTLPVTFLLELMGSDC